MVSTCMNCPSSTNGFTADDLITSVELNDASEHTRRDYLRVVVDAFFEFMLGRKHKQDSKHFHLISNAFLYLRRQGDDYKLLFSLDD